MLINIHPHFKGSFIQTLRLFLGSFFVMLIVASIPPRAQAQRPATAQNQAPSKNQKTPLFGRLKCLLSLHSSPKSTKVTDQSGHSLQLKKDDVYWLQLTNEANIRQLVFKREVKKRDGALVFEFSGATTQKSLLGPNKDLVLYRIPHSEIATIRKVDGQDESYWEFLKELVHDKLTLAQYINDLGQYLTKNYERLAVVGDHLHVYGTEKEMAPLAQKIARQTESFDNVMIHLGFTRPQSTRIILSPSSFLPHLSGPYALSVKTWNLPARKSYESTIFLGPLQWNNSVLADRSILLHERAHSILLKTYNDGAYVTFNSTVQEALADFLSAHFQNTPLIGPSVKSEFGGLRHLVQKKSKDEIGTFTLQFPIDTVHGSDHGNSLILSHVLWRVREAIGVSAMNRIIRPFIDTLNTRYASYEKLLRQEGRTGHNSVVDASTDLEFMMASLLDVADRLNESEEWKLNELLHVLAEENFYSYDRLTYVAGRLQSDYSDYTSEFIYDPLLKYRLLGLGAIGAMSRYSSLAVAAYYFLR